MYRTRQEVRQSYRDGPDRAGDGDVGIHEKNHIANKKQGLKWIENNI